MDVHIILIFVVSTVVLAAMYLSHANIDQRLRDLSAEQAVISAMVAPRDPAGVDGDVAFFKLADILTGGQRAPEGQGGMATIVEEADANADEGEASEDPAEQVGVRKRKRGAGEIKTGGRAAAQGQMHVRYSVPPVRIGLPAYDIEDARGYVRDKLTAKGFEVRREAGHELLIDWTDAVRRAEKEACRKKKKRARKPRGERAASPKRVPPREMELPDMCKDPNDIFALPSLRAVRATVARLK
ncbi:hypothetical protein KFL_002190320 [Klebsormidium nitens]|uniref:Uncharacterized protein n=1 Tax=Klebsormidium nitens TaxID=105231 RepID=A0A1Y1I6N0_KLENI|nr:hypothetical protein KFL_002190320 [Klebsormidium nitens]|eukprot:GAQ85079.1 hypothetical protein KFL_002190320 [Klebsormidium nitens]